MMPLPATIRARVHDNALPRMTRTYAATLREIFTELLQNSRRAGATRVSVDVNEAPAGTFTIIDDAVGIARPEVLLSFGENGWNERLVGAEDVAGTGKPSFAQHGATAWRGDLAPAHSSGEREAFVVPDATIEGVDIPQPHGTAARFIYSGPRANR